jgi:hypothetical protein
MSPLSKLTKASSRLGIFLSKRLISLLGHEVPLSSTCAFCWPSGHFHKVSSKYLSLSILAHYLKANTLVI